MLLLQNLDLWVPFKMRVVMRLPLYLDDEWDNDGDWMIVIDWQQNMYILPKILYKHVITFNFWDT